MCLSADDAAAKHFGARIPYGELAGCYAALGFVEEDVQSAFATKKSGALEGLAVADPDAAAETTRQYNILKAEIEKLYEQYDVFESEFQNNI